MIAFRIFLPHPSSPARLFLPHPSSPARRGSTSPPKSSLLRRKDLKPGRPGLYEQTSARPKGLLVIIYAIELRLSKRRGRTGGLMMTNFVENMQFLEGLFGGLELFE